MRDGLTFLAGLVLLALLGALVAPAFVDWSQHRTLVEEQLRRATGLSVVTTGPIHVRLLPSPRIKIAGMRAGEADPHETRISVGSVRAELELAPLLRGEVRLADVYLDDVDVTVAVRGGAAVLPASLSAAVIPGVERLAVTRGQVRLVNDAGVAFLAMPFSAEASWPRALGPARVEGEIAGRSIRLTTGDRDGAGRLRIKLSSVDSLVRAEFDGWVGVDTLSDQQIGLRPDGQLTASLVRGVQDVPQLSANGRLQGGGGTLTLASLSVDLGGAGRLEGDAAWQGDWRQPVHVNLGSRRVDLGAWLDQMGALGQADLLPGWVAESLPPVRLSLAADQVSYRGEEGTEARIVALRTASGWQPEGGQIRFAGAVASFRQRSEAAFTASLVAPDLRRMALAMQRLDMPQGIAEDFAALGQIDALVDLTRLDRSWRMDAWRLTGRFGEASGTGSIDRDLVTLRGAIRNADALFLVRPLTALAGLVPQTLTLALTGEALRMGASPPGSGTLEATRAAGRWRLDRIEARGFDGLDLRVEQDAGTRRLAFAMSAARSDAVGRLAERLGGSASFTKAVRALRGVSPLRLNGTADERDTDWLITATGQAGPLSVETSARVTSAGAWLGGDLSLGSSERALLFRALGLPEPANGQVATRAVARLGQAGPSFLLSGSDGLAVEARGRWLARQAGVLDGPLDVTFQAPLLATALPAFGTDKGLAGGLEGRLTLRLAEDQISLDNIVATPLPAPDAAVLPLTGTLAIGPSDMLSGALKLPVLDLGMIVGWLTGGSVTVPDGSWSGARFGDARTLLALRLDLSSDGITAPLIGAMQGSLRLESDDGAVRLSRIRLSAGSVGVTGSIELERAGTQLSLRAAGEVSGVDLAKALGGDAAGAGRLIVQLGASGESPARMAGSLAGSARFESQNLAIGRFDPAALPRIAQTLASDIATPDAHSLAQSVRQTVEAAPWRLGEPALAAVIAGGIARLTPVSEDRGASSLTLQGQLDMRTGLIDLRSSMLMKTPPRGWTGPAPQISLAWRGPWRAAQRSYDVSALSSAVSQRALQREIERVEAFEADIRERAQFNRRLRAERERREEEQRQAAAEAQRQAAAEAQRQAAAEAQRQAAAEAQRQAAAEAQRQAAAEAQRQAAAEAQRQAAAEAQRQAAIEAQRLTAEAEQRGMADAARREQERLRASTQFLAPALPPPISIAPVPLPHDVPGQRPLPPLNLNPVLRPQGTAN
jgi:hypothetical protein